MKLYEQQVMPPDCGTERPESVPRPEPIPRPEPQLPAEPDEGPVSPPTPALPPEVTAPDPLPSDSIDPALLSLAMGFVPRQPWESPYAYDVALKRGTIFPALDKPYLGEEAIPE